MEASKIKMTEANTAFAVLFADVSGSTRLYEKLGNAEALIAVGQCLDLVRAACEGRSGRVVKTIGDEAMTVFRSVDDAVEAAADYLLNANMPLVYGMSNVTCEAQREAVTLAEMVGGIIDSHTSL